MKDERPWLKPLGLVYGQLMEWRNQLYDQGHWRTEGVLCPVVSVGNLSVGGTGKTPVIMALLKKAIQLGYDPAVVSRGYRRQTSGVNEVLLSTTSSSQQYGDEPVLIKSRFPQVPVYVGAKRVEAAKLAQQKHQLDLILADDAFQHRALKRQLDILVIDSTQSLASLNPLPWGLGREKSSGLRRAGVIILNKINLSSPEQLAQWRQWLSSKVRSTQVVVEASYQALSLTALNGGTPFAAEEWLACAGVARPESFLSLLKNDLQLNVTHQRWFKDHHAYTTQDLKEISTQLHEKQGVVITEKDAVKWRELSSVLADRTVVAGLELRWEQGEEALDRAFTNVIS